ncbi:ABC transporter substrate-binding protein [Massilia sp. TS11]|uniref:substrate-binding periplasmic protein n=1 Tax=Massilia sp. TS11 TaxID=2908003 RepID=UPI001EDC2265|nr:transporter substrate-binding domain-containing protein [Massilia sp. TS11]MCG2583500.1 transporter substrate-binding domain-containing protein [Massilia sp. TS11]
MRPSRLPRLLCAALLAAAAVPAWAAGCTRPLNVPLAPLGVSVIVEGEHVSGIYPRLLERISDRTGCQFKTSVVPQARLEALFAAGGADIMAPASQTRRRDQLGSFVALMETRAMLLSLDKAYASVHSLDELLGLKEVRVAVVRGNDYGEAYQNAVHQLELQGRLYRENDPEHVARLLTAGMADVALITPMSLAHAIKSDSRTAPALPRLRMTALRELGWRASGVYLSLTSLNAAERDYLAHQFREHFRTDEVWDAYKRYYPPEVLAVSVRRR